MSLVEHLDRPPLPQALGVGVVTGVLAGALVGVGDALWSWGAVDQFLPTLSGRLGFVAFLVLCYGLGGAVAGGLFRTVWLLFERGTALGDLATAWSRAHRAMGQGDPIQALRVLALAVTMPLCVSAALWAAYGAALPALAGRKHMGLVIASAFAVALGALLVGVLAAFLAATLLARLMGPLGRSRSVTAPATANITLVLVTLAVGACAVVASWDTLRLLGLRPVWVALGGLVLVLPAKGTARRLVAAMGERAPWARRSAATGLVVALVLGALLLGESAAIRKAALGHSGLGGPLMGALRTLGDLDRDGYSRILGGEDCDDWSPDVHPGAPDVPGDGIDQNCVGGDATPQPLGDPTPFAVVPDAVPGDFHVLLLTVDTLRADHMGAYGYERPTSPAMDRIAREGTLFQNAWAHAPSTRYSMPAILTGRYPLHVDYDHSVKGWPGLSLSNTTLAEVLQSQGFATAAILNYWYFDGRHIDQGFDRYDNSNRRLHKGVAGEGPAHSRGSSSREQTDKALAAVRSHQKGRLFLWVHYYDPHYEYERHRGVTDFGSAPMDLYDHEIAHTDRHIGRLIDGLKERGLYDRTVIVITGDHGEGFGEHGIDLHGYHLYSAQTRIPLIVRVPGLAPSVITTPVGHVDILPTLANLAGAAQSPQMMGRSLVGLMTGTTPDDEDRVVFQQLSYGDHEMRAAAGRRCHVIYNVVPDTSWELYRIDQDPQETRDVIDDPGPCASARSVLETWYERSEIPDGAVDALLEAPPDLAPSLDADFGGKARLLSVELSADTVRAGESVHVTFTFEALARVSDRWRVFAHFERQSGGGRFQADHRPVRPFAWWRPGDFVRYTKPVAIPRTARAGTYDLWVGLFRKRERLPAVSATATIDDDRVLGGSLTVMR